MIDESTLLSFAGLFADERQLEKDYLLNLMLKTISINRASSHLEFKGGTALYTLHGLDRFSEDLDFSYLGDAKKIGSEIDKLIGPVIKDFGLSYRIAKNKDNILVRDGAGGIVGVRSELFVEGPLFGKNGVRHKIKVDISARQDTIEKPETARFVSKYYDVGTVLTYSMPLRELLAEKLCAIMERDEARDVYDAYFILRYKDIAYDKEMLVKKLKLRREKFGEKELFGKIMGMKERAWKEELSYLVRELPKLAEVKGFLLGLIGTGTPP